MSAIQFEDVSLKIRGHVAPGSEPCHLPGELWRNRGDSGTIGMR